MEKETVSRPLRSLPPFYAGEEVLCFSVPVWFATL